MGLVLGTLLLMIFGYYHSRKSSHDDRISTMGKFGAVGLSIVFMALPLLRPHFSSYSRIETLDEVKIESPNSIESIAKLNEIQTENIERLKSEAIKIRDEVDQLNDYYWIVNQFYSTMAFVLLSTFVFRKKRGIGASLPGLE